jgi:hypothetical protein
MDLLAGQRGANLRRLPLPDVEIQIDVENMDYHHLSQSATTSRTSDRKTRLNSPSASAVITHEN